MIATLATVILGASVIVKQLVCLLTLCLKIQPCLYIVAFNVLIDILLLSLSA